MSAPASSDANKSAADLAQAKSDADTVNDFSGQLHVWLPYKRGLPPHMGRYLKEAWRRREFMRETARASVRANQQDTWFGQLWNLINPLLSGLIYFALVTILVRGAGIPHFFIYLISGLFLFEVLDTCISKGARSVTSAGKTITNTAFPRILLPLSVVRNALSELGPAVIVILVLGLATGVRPSWAWIACVPIVIILMVFCTGMAMLFATVQIYFRDTRGFIPFITRAWMFGSPVLWTASMLPEDLSWYRWVNPMFELVSGWSMAITQGVWPPAETWIAGPLWAIASLLIGGYVFLSREREFAFRV